MMVIPSEVTVASPCLARKTTASGLLSLDWKSSKSVVLQDCWACAAEKRNRDGAMVLLMALVECRHKMRPARKGSFLTANPAAAPPDVSKAEYRAKRTLEATAALRRPRLVESSQDAGAVWWQLTR